MQAAVRKSGWRELSRQSAITVVMDHFQELIDPAEKDKSPERPLLIGLQCFP
jgi:hypothetical protein